LYYHDIDFYFLKQIDPPMQTASFLGLKKFSFGYLGNVGYRYCLWFWYNILEANDFKLVAKMSSHMSQMYSRQVSQ